MNESNEIMEEVNKLTKEWDENEKTMNNPTDIKKEKNEFEFG